MIYRLEAARLNDILKFRIRLRAEHNLLEEAATEDGNYYAVIETVEPITIHSGLIEVYDLTPVEPDTDPTS